MRLSKKSEYALRALVAIGKLPATHLHQIQELSKTENIPVKFLEQILLALRHAGLLTSRRGVHGGYSLARPAARISAGEVIRLMDGPLAPVPCASPNGSDESCTCPDPNRCALRILMTGVRNQLSELLDGQSIEDIAKLVPDQGPIEFQI